MPPAVPRRRGGVFVSAEGGFLTPRSRRLTRPLMSGSAKRARPRLIRVRLADNLRGAPGGPADPNGTSGSPPPADRWSHGSPRGSTPGDDAGGERSGRVGALPPPFPPGRESLHASGRNSHGSYPQSPTVVKRTRRGVRFSKLATERALAGEMVSPRTPLVPRSAAMSPRFKFSGSDENSQSGQPRGPHQNTKSTDSAVLRAIVSGASVVPTRRS